MNDYCREESGYVGLAKCSILTMVLILTMATRCLMSARLFITSSIYGSIQFETFN
jgi:hypothetical protein